MSYCQYCKEEFGEGRFCPRCGRPMTADGEQTQRADALDSDSTVLVDDEKTGPVFGGAYTPPQYVQPRPQPRQNPQQQRNPYPQQQLNPYPPQAMRPAYPPQPMRQAPVQPQKSGSNIAIIAAIIALAILIAAGIVAIVILSQDEPTPAVSTVSEAPSSAVSAGSQSQSEVVSANQGSTVKIDVDNATEFVSATATAYLKSVNYNGKTLTYDPENVLKENTACWATPGSGVGESITLTLPEDQRVSGLTIVNGYAGVERQYVQNSKVVGVRCSFDDGKEETHTLEVRPTSERKYSQNLAFDESHITGSVTITILSISEGTKYQDTCITYIEPY